MVSVRSKHVRVEYRKAGRAPESSAGVPVKAAIAATTQEVAQSMLAQS